MVRTLLYDLAMVRTLLYDLAMVRTLLYDLAMVRTLLYDLAMVRTLLYDLAMVRTLLYDLAIYAQCINKKYPVARITSFKQCVSPKGGAAPLFFPGAPPSQTNICCPNPSLPSF